MTNPLLERHELPPFKAIKPGHVIPAIDHLIASHRSELVQLVKNPDPDWKNLIDEMEEMDDSLSRAFSPVSHMNGVVNTPELRDVYNACLPKLTEYQTDLGQNAELFAAYQKISGSDAYAGLSQAQKKTLENAIRDFRLSGIDLSKADQIRFADISKRLSQLTSSFNDNVLDATMAWSKLIIDGEELKGLPQTALDLTKQMAEERQQTGYLLTLDVPVYQPVLTYCENADLRKEMYEAFTTRASDEGPHAGQWDNTSNIQEILSLRTELSRLLGFENYAQRSLATKMAQSTDQVLSFLQQLAAKSKSAAEEEFLEICNFAEQEFGIRGLKAWDVNFYAEKYKERKFNLSDEDVRPYFPAPTCVTGMFEVVRRLYDIEIQETLEIETWHKDVTTYNVLRDGQPIARFYLDLYARSNKRGGAWMDDCRVRRINVDGSLQLPVAYLTCNFSAPIGETPSLLTHNEVITLFHEFGHGLHHMLTRVTCAPVSGINGVAWDAMELPSQFMENWCWQEEALQFISGHFETGEPLPAEMLKKMLAAKNFQSAMMTVRQLEFAMFDFRLHLEFDEARQDQVQQVLNDVRTEVAVVPVAEFNRFQHGFSHIFGGGYAAGYYSYKWAEVLSADAFSKFQEDGIFNRQTGEKFLSSILEQGGSVDAMQMFVAFRGREPEIEALLKQDGIL